MRRPAVTYGQSASTGSWPTSSPYRTRSPSESPRRSSRSARGGGPRGQALARPEAERPRRKPPDSLDAWDLYQRGLWHVWQVNAKDNSIARELFERAIALDPGFSPFHSALDRQSTRLNSS